MNTEKGCCCCAYYAYDQEEQEVYCSLDREGSTFEDGGKDCPHFYDVAVYMGFKKAEAVQESEEDCQRHTTDEELDADIEYLRDKILRALEPSCNSDKGFYEDDSMDEPEEACPLPSEEELAAQFDFPEERYTCFDCPDKDTCEYAFDAYCTDGDCLILK